MATMAARAARKFRSLTKGGLDSDHAVGRVVSDAKAVTCWKESNRHADGTVVTYPLDYPIRSSLGLLFPDDSALIFGAEKVWVSRIAGPSKDVTVYHYIDDLIPVVPIGRYRRVPYAVRYAFTETEQRLVVEATQMLDTLLLNEWNLKLPPWMRWFPNDRLFVKNLISAGGDANALCSLLLGMLSNKRLTRLETASEDDDGSVVTIRHQPIP